jgi:hypothetical protein
MTRRARYTPPALPRVAALYARVSTRVQGEDDKASLPTQIAAMRASAEAQGFTTCEDHRGDFAGWITSMIHRNSRLSLHMLLIPIWGKIL